MALFSIFGHTNTNGNSFAPRACDADAIFRKALQKSRDAKIIGTKIDKKLDTLQDQGTKAVEEFLHGLGHIK